MHWLRKVNKKEIKPEEALQQFLFFKKAQGLADTTKKGYDYQIKTVILADLKGKYLMQFLMQRRL